MRCSTRSAGSRRTHDGDRTARRSPSTPSGRCCGAEWPWSRWHARVGSRSSPGATIRCARSSRGTGELIAAAARQRRAADHRRCRWQRIDRRRPRRASTRSAGSFPRSRSTVACDVTTTFLDAARVYGPQKGAIDRAGRAARPPPRPPRRAVRIAYRRRRARRRRQRRRRRARRRARRARRDARTRLRRRRGRGRSRRRARRGRRSSSPERAGSIAPASRARSSVASLEWASEHGVARRAVIAGQVVADAREPISRRRACSCSRSSDRVWQASETFTRAALLVEEHVRGRAQEAVTDVTSTQSEARPGRRVRP